jgi:hypothetical protein
MLVGTAATIVLLGVAAVQTPASACSKSNGCTQDVQNEDYKMMHDGRMNEAIKEGQANMEAFRAMREAEQARQARQPTR